MWSLVLVFLYIPSFFQATTLVMNDGSDLRCFFISKYDRQMCFRMGYAWHMFVRKKGILGAGWGTFLSSEIPSFYLSQLLNKALWAQASVYVFWIDGDSMTVNSSQRNG